MGNHDQIPGINQRAMIFLRFLFGSWLFFCRKNMLLVFLHFLLFSFIFPLFFFISLSFSFFSYRFFVIFSRLIHFPLVFLYFLFVFLHFPRFPSFSIVVGFSHWFFLYFQFSFGFPSFSKLIITFFVFPSFIHFLKDWDFGIPPAWTKATKIIHLWVSNEKK